MAILREHIPYYQEILKLEGFLKDPVLVFGFQDCLMGKPPSLIRMTLRWLRLRLAAKIKGHSRAVIRRPVQGLPEPYDRATLQEILRYHGATAVRTLDAFDGRADVSHDMNLPLPEVMVGQYNTVIDIGSLEHVFDTRQCLENLFRMVRVGGHILLHAPCNGYCGHGFHTFSPDCIVGALQCNGFSIRYLKFSSREGFELTDPGLAPNSLIWVVAQKQEDQRAFVIPQQKGWATLYDKGIFPYESPEYT